MTPTHDVVLRRARSEDAGGLADLFVEVRRAGEPAIPPLVHPVESVEPFLAGVVARDTVWLAEDDGAVVAFLALGADGDVDHLYVRGSHARRGVGARLLDLAKDAHPTGLALWTFAANTGARRFYARHGFVEVGGTDGDNEEGAPDIRMEWRPDDADEPVSAGGSRR